MGDLFLYVAVFVHVDLSLAGVEKSAYDDSFPWDVQEDGGDELLEPLSNSCINDRPRAWEPREYVVIDLTVFELLHQTDHLALDNLARSKGRVRDDEAIDVASVVGRCADDEAVRKQIRSRHRCHARC